MFLCINLIFVI